MTNKTDSHPVAQTQFMEAAWDKIKTEDWVSIVELERIATSTGMATDGDYWWHAKRDANIVFWANVSEEFVDALMALEADPRMVKYPGSVLSYYADGEGLTLPLVQRPPKDGYKEPHWLPVFFRPASAVK